MPEQAKAAIPVNEQIWTQASAYAKARGLPALAASIGRSRSLLSRYLARQLDNPQYIEEALAAFFARQERFATGAHFVWTDPAQAVMAACDYAYSYRKLVPIPARAGMGKTTGVLEYLNRYHSGGKRAHVWVDCADGMTTRDFLVDLYSKLTNRETVRGSKFAILQRVIAELAAAPRLLIIDEANKLSVRTLENVRYIYDHAGCGTILVGTKVLMERLLYASGRAAEELEQLYSRLGLRPPLIPAQLSRKDAERVARAKRPELLAEEMELLLARPHTPRAIHNILDRAAYLKGLKAFRALPFRDCLERAVEEIFEAA